MSYLTMAMSRPGKERPVERPMCTWEDNVSSNVRDLRVVAVRVRWRGMVPAVIGS